MRGGGRALLAAGLLALGLCPRGQSPPAIRPNLLLITLDTTRADHLGCYGDAAAKTPVLDALAAGGALFLEAHAHVPLTLPSHANILTGSLPSTLNLRVNGLKLKEGVPTLATILKEKGYWTGAAVSSVILARERGLARGFAVYDDRMTLPPRTGGAPEERTAGDTTEAALRMLQNVKGPFFLWVHYYDPHYEYRPPEPFAKAFAKSPYDGEIAYMDECVGRLLAGLKASGRLDDTLVVAAGDHGEGLGEHGEQQHGVFLYEYALRVPLLFSWPGHIKPGIRVRGLCGLCDLAPTVTDLLGVRGPAMDGTDLKPLLEGGTARPETLYAESYHGFFNYGWAPLRGLMDDRFKYIQAPRPELYEWKAGEANNLFQPGDPRAVKAEKDLARFPPADQGEKAEMERFLKDPSNAETLRQLTSLGYLSGGGARPDTPGLLDPKDAIGIEDELQQATAEMAMSDTRKATERLLAVLKRNPSNVPALSMLGIIYLNQGQVDKARVCFEEEIRLKPQMDTAHLNLGTAYKRMGKPDLAEKEYRAALALSPRMPEATANLAQVLAKRGNREEARRLLEGALSGGVETADIYFELGLLDATENRLDKARYDFTKVVSLDPRRGEALANLGQIAYQQGRIDESIANYQRASRVEPRNASYLATLGSLYLNGKNDPAEALSYYQKAIAVDPYGKDAATLKELVRNLQQEGER